MGVKGWVLTEMASEALNTEQFVVSSEMEARRRTPDTDTCIQTELL